MCCHSVALSSENLESLQQVVFKVPEKSCSCLPCLPMLWTCFSILADLGAARLSKSTASQFIKVSVVSKMSAISLRIDYIRTEG